MNTLIQTSPEQSRMRILRKTFLALAVVLALTVGRVNAEIPMLTWAPETSGVYDYGTVTVGQPVSQLFTLTNNGGSASAALTVSISGRPFLPLPVTRAVRRVLDPVSRAVSLSSSMRPALASLLPR